ncbi:MAG: hypothetical protein EOP38_06520 [Rubrivivax sp.]|nr:MAG: hypothetical protein EOP38_06520 [Rubrivivax sp.]
MSTERTGAKRVSLILLAAIGAAVLLAVGMQSALQKNQLFQWFLAIKTAVSPPVIQGVPSQLRANEFGQLVHDQGKRPVARPDITDRTMVAFAFGQSNAANHGGERHASASGRVYNHFAGQYFMAADPLLGGSGYFGSVWTLLADQLIDAGLHDRIVLLTAGVGDSSVKDWQPGGRLHGMLRQRLEQTQKSGLVVTHFLWHQGEADHDADPTEYAAALNRVIDVARGYFPQATFFVAQASRCDGRPSSPAILAAQRGIARRPGVFLGANTDAIDDADRYDGCHFSGRGLARHAQQWLQALRTPKQAE